MNQLTNRAAGTIMTQSQVFDNLPDEDWDDLLGGVAISFPILGIKGGKFHYRFKGDDTVLTDARGFPVPALEVVILRSQAGLSRTFYAGGYEEGVNRRPDCWSSDGVRPDDTVVEPVNSVCQTCPNAQWSSGATPAAPKAQACQQRRRTVIVPYWGDGDMSNESGGGPVLLSVPPSSLTNQYNFGKEMKENRIRYYSCVVQLSFDPDPKLSFPRLEFKYLRPLTDDEARQVLEVRQGEQIDRILQSKMNVDGPEVLDGHETPVGGSAQPPGAAAMPQARTPGAASATKAASSVRPAPQQPKPTLQAGQAAQPMQQAQPQTQPAGRPVQPGTAVRPGVQQGAAVGAGRPVQPSASTAGRPSAGTQGINEAVARPATAPQSQRTVRQPVPPPVEEAQQDGVTLDEAAGEMLMEAEATATLPDGMTGVFANLMRRS